MNHPAPFRRQLHFWSLHVPVGATMSFVAAWGVGFNRPQSVVGMIGGVLVFLFLYARVWSSAWFRHRVPEGSRWDRALVYSARVRSASNLLGITGLVLQNVVGSQQNQPVNWAIPFLIFCVPDLALGMCVGFFTEWCVQSALVKSLRIAVAGTDAHVRGQSLSVGDIDSLLPSFCITLLQGVVLSFYLLVIASAALGLMRLTRWWKSRRMAGPAAHPALT